MKILIPLVAGVVIGIAVIVSSYGFIAHKVNPVRSEPDNINVPGPTGQNSPVGRSPFAPVSRSGKRESNEDTFVDSTSADSANTSAQPIADFADIKDYRELKSALQSLELADSGELKSLLSEMPDNLYDKTYVNALNTAIYQRWAEIDIDGALLYVVEIFEGRGRRHQGNPTQAISILASMNPEYVSDWIENYASDNPALMHAAYSGIASKDPEAFIKSFLENSKSANPLREDEFGTFHTALMQWGEQDPQSAFAFLNSEQELGDLEGMKENLLYMWFERDPYAAIAEIEALLNDPLSSSDSRMMLTDLYTRHLAETNPDSALQWALAQEDPMLRESSLMSIIYSWGDSNPDSLLSFIDQLPPAERESVLPMAAPAIAASMARNDPAGAIAWAEQLPVNSRQGAIMSIVDQWIHTDSTSAMNWLRNQPDTAENQGILMNAAGSLLYRDPALASEVFTTLPVNVQNVMAEQMIFMQLDRGPDAAKDWLVQQTNPTVLEIGSIVLDTMNPDVDSITVLDRIASLQSNNRQNLIMSAISERASDMGSIRQWITESTLLTEEERIMLKQMTGNFSSGYGSPYYSPGDFSDEYYMRP